MRSGEVEGGEEKDGYKEAEWRWGKFNPTAVGP
jgi:hypothetical protein